MLFAWLVAELFAWTVAEIALRIPISNISIRLGTSYLSLLLLAVLLSNIQKKFQTGFHTKARRKKGDQILVIILLWQDSEFVG